MSRFVVQEHLAQKAGLHFDFRFEENGVAPSWAIPKNFSQDKQRIAIQVEDHQVSYMDFEGTIEGYGAGTVTIWEKGELTILERTPNLIRFSIKEGKLIGSWCLSREAGAKWFLNRDTILQSGIEQPSLLEKDEIILRVQEIADRLKSSGEANQFRIRGYQNAVGIIQRTKNFEFLSDRQLQQLPGLGKTLSGVIFDLRKIGTTKLLEELRASTQLKKRFPYAEAFSIAQALVKAIKEKFPDSLVETAGSLRRGKDPKDIDILIAGDEKESIYSNFCRTLGRALNLGEKATAIAKEGIQVDLRIVPKKAYGAGLLFFTGSAEFNIRCRAKAKRLGMKLTRYGLEDLRDGKMIAQDTEKEILDAIGIEWLEPKERIS